MASAERDGSKPLSAPATLHYDPVGDSTPLLRFRAAGVDREVPFRPIRCGFLALVFMIVTLAGMAGGFLALLAFRLAVGAN